MKNAPNGRVFSHGCVHKKENEEEFMNVQELELLRTLAEKPCRTQRELVRSAGCSLGLVNRCVGKLIHAGLISQNLEISEAGYALLEASRPRNAVILAAGVGLRMVPINYNIPKGLLKVRGETLIERLIRQLHDVGVEDITVVVGFMKERFEFLVDRWDVRLAVNPEYAVKNNLQSLHIAAGLLGNSYILPCDLWCEENPFRKNELYSWYMAEEISDPESRLRISRNGELVPTGGKTAGNRMIGICYLIREDAARLKIRLEALCRDSAMNGAFWEQTLLDEDGRLWIPARRCRQTIEEINTYEQLRRLGGESDQLNSDALNVIAQVMKCQIEEIRDIRLMKKGMTNRSFSFSCRGERYLMRIPGEGTGRLINRRQEAEVYRTISGRGLCDEPVYLNPENGYKITGFLDGVRTADAEDVNDLRRCMELLRRFHGMRLKVEHSFDLYGQIEFYEALWEGQPSLYDDYARTKAGVYQLKEYLEANAEKPVLTHLDAVADNFLFYRDADGEEQLQLTDWEYAGMQDPHVDLAMFCIYSLYNKDQIDRLIDLYFEGSCTHKTRTKIYGYIAVCGLLWSNWCEYKYRLGVEFGDYSLRQYRYAKEFSRYVRAALEE